MAGMIEELSGLSDAELAKKLGFEDKVQQFKKDLADAASLKGDARDKVERELARVFGPDTWELQDIHRTVERAKNPKQAELDKFATQCGCGPD